MRSNAERPTATRQTGAGPRLSCLMLAALSLPALAGCFSRDPIDVRSPDPSSKIPGIKKAVREGDDSAVRVLVKDLESDDPAVRFYAIRALRDLTGGDLGYVYFADERDREPAVQRWKQWLAERP